MPPQGNESEVVDRGDVVTPENDKIAEDQRKPLEKPPEVAAEAEVEEVVEDLKPAEEKKDEVKEPEPRKKGEFVPRERLNEAVQKERAKAEAIAARNKELEEHFANQKVSADVEEAQKVLREYIKQRNSFLSDGELDKAGEVDVRIIDLQQAIADHKAAATNEVVKEQAKEEAKYDAMVERLEIEYPQINPDDEAYDEEAVNEVRALMRGYQVEMKMSPSAALAKAAKRIFGGIQAKEEAKPNTEVAAKRKAEATERNIDVAKKQPASTKDVGLDHDKKGGGLDAKTVMNLSYDEFVKIGDDVLSRLRGDTL